MTRVLTLQRTIVPPAERRKFLERARERKAEFGRANCSFWLFEEKGLPGAFIEFVESASDDALTGALTAARAAAPEGIVDPARIYTEVELS
jgi:hypothetical protein